MALRGVSEAGGEEQWPQVVLVPDLVDGGEEAPLVRRFRSGRCRRGGRDQQQAGSATEIARVRKRTTS
jgi:hypothetical protein